MFLEVISPTKTLFENDVAGVQLPGTQGSFEIRERHAPIISTLQKGVIRIRMHQQEDTLIPIDGGVVEVNNNKIIILVSSD